MSMFDPRSTGADGDAAEAKADFMRSIVSKLGVFIKQLKESNIYKSVAPEKSSMKDDLDKLESIVKVCHTKEFATLSQLENIEGQA